MPQAVCEHQRHNPEVVTIRTVTFLKENVPTLVYTTCTLSAKTVFTRTDEHIGLGTVGLYFDLGLRENQYAAFPPL